MDPDPATVALHADHGIEAVPDVAPPIRVATTFDRSEQNDLVYRREQHATTRRLEKVMGTLEGGHAVAYPSGMAAVAAVLRDLSPGRVSLPEDCYHGTRAFVTAEAAAGRWETSAPDRLGAGDVHWVETPSNPRCLVTDVSAASASARAHGALVVVDSTFATPVLQRPLDLGADAVVHAATKFIGGHSDALGGIVVVPDAQGADRLRRARAREGAVPGALETWLVLRGIRTLPLRVERQSATATAVATHLAGRGLRVWYPWLPGHPGHEVARAQMRAGGGILSFELEDDAAAAAVVSRLRLFTMATSLGGVESLAEHRRSVDPEAPPGLIRLSIGLEGAADLVADLDQALD